MLKLSDTSQSAQLGKQQSSSQYGEEQSANPQRNRRASQARSGSILAATTVAELVSDAHSKSRLSSTPRAVQDPIERSFSPGNASEYGAIRRGKDWESEFRPNSEKVNSPLLNGSPSNVFEQRKIFEESSLPAKLALIHRRHKSELLSMQEKLSQNGAQSQNRPPVLQLSKIQTIQTIVVPLSPISLGPCSSTDSHLDPPHSPQPASPEHPLLTKYTTAFEYALEPYLKDRISFQPMVTFPPSLSSTTSTPISSPYLPPRRASEISFSSTSSTSELAIRGLPAHLAHLDTWPKRLALIRVRTLLMHCSVLQTNIHWMLRIDEHIPRGRPIHWHYSKMRYLAYKARASAQAFDSRDWQARCEYWLGRACGGTRDWQAARECFGRAKHLDVPDEVDEDGRIVRRRGLKRAEREDVERLFDIAERNEEVWKREVEKVRREAEYWSGDERVLVDWTKMERIGSKEWDRDILRDTRQ